MSDLMNRAIDRLRHVAPDDRDKIAWAVIQLVDEDSKVIEISGEDQAAIDEAEAEFERGEVATDAEVKAIWAKYGF